jgi:hypothetical protein
MTSKATDEMMRATAERGILLNSEVKKLSEELDGIKKDLRGYGEVLVGRLSVGDEAKTVEIETSKGTVQVTFKKDTFSVPASLHRSVKTLLSQGILPQDTFDAIFEEVVTVSYKVRKGHESVLASLTLGQQKEVNQYIQQNSLTPAITFPKV